MYVANDCQFNYFSTQFVTNFIGCIFAMAFVKSQSCGKIDKASSCSIFVRIGRFGLNDLESEKDTVSSESYVLK